VLRIKKIGIEINLPCVYLTVSFSEIKNNLEVTTSSVEDDGSLVVCLVGREF